jgi:DNA-binding beta-propeller fold protein YncE
MSSVVGDLRTPTGPVSNTRSGLARPAAPSGASSSPPTLVDFLGVGVSPWGIATNGTYAYVANSLSNTVSVIALCPS